MPTSQRDPVFMPCSVFIPDLRQRPPATGGARLPALERLVARARRVVAPSPADFLAPLFGLQPQALTPAPYMHLADTGKADGRYRLCADFVHLAPDRDQLVFMPQGVLETRSEELAALAAAFNSLYGADGWALELMPQGRAYLCCPRPLEVVTAEPGAIAGQAVLAYMPAGADAPRLKQLMNEVQMLFHTHPVNQAREDTGRPLINSLWLWGGGSLPETRARRPRAVVGDLPLLRGLALWSGSEASGAPGEDVLLGSTSMDLTSMEREWFAPLFAALKRGELKGLDLYLGGLGLFTLDSTAARRFWRRPRPLATVSP